MKICAYCGIERPDWFKTVLHAVVLNSKTSATIEALYMRKITVPNAA